MIKLLSEKLSNMIKSKHISDYKINSKTLWKSMNLATKLKWFKYNTLFPTWGKIKREVIELHYELDIREWEHNHPDRNVIDCPLTLKYPDYLEPNPDGVIIVKMEIKPVFPVEHINISIELPK